MRPAIGTVNAGHRAGVRPRSQRPVAARGQIQDPPVRLAHAGQEMVAVRTEIQSDSAARDERHLGELGA